MKDIQPSFLFQPAERRYQVGELNREIASLLSVEFSDIWVEGEISGVRPSRQGHIYFTLKDAESAINCVCFRNALRVLRIRPAEGLAVAVRGRVDVYEVRGQYQFIAEAMELRGQGALQVAFEQLKKTLEAEGLFRPERKRPLPPLPKRIGIVTSPTGAALQDMLSIFERRFPGLHIRIYPTLVQGDAAPEQVAAGLRFFSENSWAEVVIVGRGGGSLEDLWAFNTEVVARAIASSAVPVVSAVGHETDFTIADFVADLRAPTPSAAAELTVPRKDELLAALEARRVQLHRAYQLMLFGKLRLLQTLGTERAHAVLQRRLRVAAQRLDELDFRMRDSALKSYRDKARRFEQTRQQLMQFDLRLRLGKMSQSLQWSTSRLLAAGAERLHQNQVRLGQTATRLHALSPLAILDRGYALAHRGDGTLVRDAATLQVSDALKLRFARGSAVTRVEATELAPPDTQ